MATTVTLPPVRAAGTRERCFRAMGTTCHVVVVGGRAGAAEDAEARIAVLEGRWSRFRPDSDVRRLNRAGGAPVRVSDDTVQLLAAARRAWSDTRGRFDPTVLPWLEEAGYDVDIEQVRARHGTQPATVLPPLPTAGLGGLDLDPALGTARLPAHVLFDPGGIGKGLAADIVVAELLAAGAAGALVSLGGDLVVAGEPPSDDAWGVDVAPDRAGSVGRLALRSGAVATSTTALRRWRRDGRWWHHAIDPSTGRPAEHGPRAVTVVAGRGWRAETIATALLVTPDTAHRADLTAGPGVGALVLDAGGGVTRLGRVERYLR